MQRWGQPSSLVHQFTTNAGRQPDGSLVHAAKEIRNRMPVLGILFRSTQSAIGAFADLRPLRGGAIAGLRAEAPGHEACARRQQLADDHVLLQAEERIGGGTDGRACQHLDGVLERGGREQRVGAEGGLRHAQQDILELGGLLAFGQQLLVELAQLQAVDRITGQVLGVAGASDAPCSSSCG